MIRRPRKARKLQPNTIQTNCTGQPAVQFILCHEPGRPASRSTYPVAHACGNRDGYVACTHREPLAGARARVPSIRMMADALGVSKSTVVDAYERLASEGVLVARRGSGFYVSGHAPPLALADLGPQLDRGADPLWLSRQSLEAAPTSVKPGCGWLPPSWLPDEPAPRAARRVARRSRCADRLCDTARPARDAPTARLAARAARRPG